MSEDSHVIKVSATDSASAVFRNVESAAKGLEKQYRALETAFSSVAAGVALHEIVDATLAWERASVRIDAALKAQGGSTGLARREIDQLTVSISNQTEFTNRQVTEAAGQLVKFGNIHDEVFKRALEASADYAAFTGQDLASAAQSIGRALADPVQGVRMLQKELGNLTYSEKTYIQQLEANGRTQEAQNAILDIVQSKIGGTAQTMNKDLVGAVSNVKKGWEELLETIGKSDRFQRAAGGLGDLFSNLSHGSLAPPSGSQAAAPASWEEQFAQQQAALAAMVKKNEEAADRTREAWAKATPVLQAYSRAVGETSHEQETLNFVLQGEGKTLPDAAKAIILNTAVLLDYRREIQYDNDAIKQLVAQHEKLDQIEKEQKETNVALLEQLAFETQMIGKSAAAQEEATALRENDLRTREKLRQAAEAAGDNDDAYLASARRIKAEAAETDAAIIAGIKKRRDAERSWITGAKNTFQEYIDHATNAAEQTSFVLGNAMKSMEDAIVTFAMTGKFNFREFANSIIADIIRIEARAAIAGASSGALGFIGSIFQGGGGTGSAVGTTGDVVATSELHSGGMVGIDGRQRYVHAAYFEHAPRMHSGGLAGDEVAAILQRGERVIPRGGSAGRLVIQQHFHIGGNVTRADLANVAIAGRDAAMNAILEITRRDPSGPFSR